MEIQEISIEDLKQKIHFKEIQFIDIRPEEFFLEEHVVFSFLKNIPLQTLAEHLQDLDKNKEVYLICNHGNSSKHAAAFLQTQGFNAFSVAGGTQEWKEKYPEEVT